MHTLFNNFLWWCEHVFLVDFKECCVLELNLWPHGDHVYLSFPMVWNCGWLWHNKNHSMWFCISLKGAVIWARISLFWMFNCKHFKNYVLVKKLQNNIFQLNFVLTQSVKGFNKYSIGRFMLQKFWNVGIKIMIYHQTRLFFWKMLMVNILHYL